MASPRKSGFVMAKHSVPYDSHVPPKKRQNLMAATLSESDDSEEESRPSFGGVGLGGPEAETAEHAAPVVPPQQLEAGDSTDTTPDVARDFLVKPNAEPVYSSFAAKMMAKMGYQKGKGLGKHGQGRTGIIESSKQRGRRGLGLTIKAFEPSDVTWDYSKEFISAEEEVKWMPKCDAEIPDIETLRTWVTEGPRQHSLKDDYEFCTEKLVEDVNKCKSVFDELEPEEMRRARTKSNPYETIRGIFFLNRAAMKMANLDAVTDFLFTNPKKPDGIHSLVDPGELLYFADVCAGPGGFSEYILWRKKWEAKGFGFTLKGSHDFKLEDFFAAPSECFEPHYGVGGLDGDGNVYSPDNLREFRKFVMESTDHKGVHFVMADGGFDVDGRENDQEWLSKRLYLCECTAALSILRTGGHFVCKLFDVFLVYSVGLIYLMYLAFEEVAIFKPVTSRPANSERYLICKGLRPGAHVIHDFLFETNLRFAELGETAPTDINEIVPVDVLSTKQDFVEYIVTSNESLGVKQAIALSKIKAFAQNPQLYESRQAEMREECCRLWQIPEHARIAPDKSTKPLDKFKALIKGKDQECFSSQPELLSPENLEVIKSVYDYRCYLAAGDRRWFLLGLGKSYVFKWDGVPGGRWQKVELKMELPPDTLIEAEFVQELRGEGKGQRRVMAVHVLDAVVLGGRDVQDLHFTERLEKLSKFVKAITRPTRGDLAPIRVKENHRLEQMEEVCNRLTMRLVKGSGGQKRLCYCPQVAREEFMPTGVYFIKTVKEPWMLAFSHSKNRKYYFNSVTGASTFETPKEVIAPFSYSHKHLLFWQWDAGVQMHETQPASAPGRLSRDLMLAFITSRTQR